MSYSSKWLGGAVAIETGCGPGSRALEYKSVYNLCFAAIYCQSASIQVTVGFASRTRLEVPRTTYSRERTEVAAYDSSSRHETTRDTLRTVRGSVHALTLNDGGRQSKV